MKKIALIGLITIIGSGTFLASDVTVKADVDKNEVTQSFGDINKQENVKKICEGIKNKDIEMILKYSDDSRFSNEEEQKTFWKMEFLDPNNDVIEYELVDDGNSNDEYFLVRQYYKNGYIKEVSVKADDKKVILSDSETSTIKDIQVGKTIPMNEAQETEYNLLMEKQ